MAMIMMVVIKKFRKTETLSFTACCGVFPYSEFSDGAEDDADDVEDDDDDDAQYCLL